MESLRKFEVSGSPRKMGESYGEAFREAIRKNTETRIRHMMEFVKRGDPAKEMPREDILGMTAKTIKQHEEYDPKIWAEFSGIARGAGLSLEELLLCNGYTDFREFILFEACPEERNNQTHSGEGECSAFLVPGSKTDGYPIVGQNWDMHQDSLEFLLIMRRKPDDAPETLGLTTVGCLCLIGMNSEGVSVGNTNLVPTDACPGVNYLFTITKALTASSALDGAQIVEETPRLSGHNFYIADEKNVINVETTARESHRTVVKDEVHVHTNHILAEELRKFEWTKGAWWASTTFRCERLTGNFQKLSDPITMEDGWAQLSDNTEGEGGIVCNEDYDAIKWDFATIGCVVQCPGKREIHACAKSPRIGKKEIFKL